MRVWESCSVAKQFFERELEKKMDSNEFHTAKLRYELPATRGNEKQEFAKHYKLNQRCIITFIQ